MHFVDLFLKPFEPRPDSAIAFCIGSNNRRFLFLSQALPWLVGGNLLLSAEFLERFSLPISGITIPARDAPIVDGEPRIGYAALDIGYKNAAKALTGWARAEWVIKRKEPRPRTE